MPATISFTTKFDLSLSPKQFIIEDTADYIGQGIALADVNGCIKIVSPSGILYYNNVDFSNGGCNIRNSVSRINTIVIPLPLISGMPELGTYTITYTVYDTNTSEYYEVINTYTYSYVRPTISIDMDVDCYGPLFTSTDATDYAQEGATLVMVRDHTLNFPAGSAGASTPLNSVDATIQTGEVYTPGTDTTVITTELTYTFADGLVVYDEVTGSKEFYVDCEDACAILCCIKNYETRMNGFKISNYGEYLDMQPVFNQGMAYYALMMASRTCGLSDDVSRYMTLIKTLFNCTDACCSDSETPTQVIGLGNTRIVVVNSAGSPITVNVVVVGNTTTYTIVFDPTLLAKINASYNTVVAAGTNVTVSVVTVGDVKTYTVNATTQVLSSTLAESAVNFPVPAAVGTKVTGCTATAPATGMYLVLAESDFTTTSVAGVLSSGITYRLLKNNLTPITSDRAFINSIVEAISALDWLGTKMVTPAQVVSLTLGDTVDMYVDALSTGGIISNRSITLVKIG